MTSPDQPAPPFSTPAPDQTDRVILRTIEENSGVAAGEGDVLVIEDATGALTAHALQESGGPDSARVLTWTASAARSAQLREQFSAEIDAGRLVVPAPPQPTLLEQFVGEADVRLVLGRLPKSLSALDDHARRLAAAALRSGRDDLAVVLGGRVKHMTRQQNDVLARSFTEVRASLGLGKSRALIATGTRADAQPPSPSQGKASIAVRGETREVSLRAVGGVFGGAAADAGSLLLLDALDGAGIESVTAQCRDDAAPNAEQDGPGTGPCVVDLGCGNGLLTAYLALALPGVRVIASDDDAEAVASTRAALEAVGPAEPSCIEITWDDALSRMPDRSADLVLLNPPFHDGTALDATLVHGLLDAAARVLRPDGQLWMVHNSHLRYRTEVERRVGPVRQRARDRRFTVLSAQRI